MYCGRDKPRTQHIPIQGTSCTSGIFGPSELVVGKGHIDEISMMRPKESQRAPFTSLVQEDEQAFSPARVLRRNNVAEVVRLLPHGHEARGHGTSESWASQYNLRPHRVEETSVA